MSRKYSKVKPGVNDLATTHPEVLPQWDYTKNTTLPTEVAKGTDHIKVWWLCDKGHSWEATPNGRLSGKRIKGCPYCSGRLLLAGLNDLATTHPLLAAQWDYTKNPDDLTPQTVRKGSQAVVWWLCDKGHSFSASIKDRSKTGKCEECAKTSMLSVRKHSPELITEWDKNKNTVSPEGVSYSSARLIWWVCSEGHEWQSAVYSRTRGSGCPDCSNSKGYSQAEKDIYSWVKILVPDAQSNKKGLLSGSHELDIYVPSKRIAIEYNGLYWHTEEAGKDRWYHYNKWKTCRDQGIQLIQIWEDEWESKPELVKKMLAHKLNASYGKKLYARTLHIREVGVDESTIFLNAHHIQGSTTGSCRLGLYTKEGKLEALLLGRVFTQGDDTVLDIVRYATDAVVPGGFTKLLKAAEHKVRPSKVTTFSDNSISDGALYETNGFSVEKELPPDYKYVVKKQRQHKFGYRLKRFKNDENLLYAEDLSESELAKANNLPKIWDCGKVKWFKIIE